MSMDGLALAAVCFELQALVGGKIDKVQQPDRDALLLTVRGGGKNRRLLLCAHAENGRVQLTEAAFPNPVEAPAFCMLLRRRLVGGRVAAIEQRGLDRVLTVRIAARNEFYDETEYRLIVELMGKYSNILLVQADGILADCIKHVSPDMSSVRTLLPGVPFIEAPKQEKRNPFLASLDAFRCDLDGAANPAKMLADRYQGLSRASVAALFSSPLRAEDVFQKFSAFASGTFSPTLLSDTYREPVAVYPFLPAEPSGHETQFPTMSEAYDVFYARKDAVVRIQRNGAALRRVLENHLSRAENKLSAYTDAIESESRFEEYRLYGELLTANLYQIKRGQASAVLDNYYDDPPTRSVVPLDPLLSPQDNAQRYYKRYRKSKTARDYALSQRDALLAEIQYLEGQLDNIGKCETLAELLEIREELIHERYIRPERKGAKAQGSGVSKPMSFRSSDGLTILVGRNNRQNDLLTLRTATSEQLWLHAKNIPGSHVIVQENADAVPPETLREAALLAAYYSHARASGSVPVDYTPRKFVKKPSGAKPGMVIYSTNRTLFVTPDEADVKRIERID